MFHDLRPKTSSLSIKVETRSPENYSRLACPSMVRVGIAAQGFFMPSATCRRLSFISSVKKKKRKISCFFSPTPLIWLCLAMSFFFFFFNIRIIRECVQMLCVCVQVSVCEFEMFSPDSTLSCFFLCMKSAL